jgi:HNH endonuclease
MGLSRRTPVRSSRPLKRTSTLTRATPLTRRTPLARGEPSRNSTASPGAPMAASPAQRRKVAGAPCVVCGKRTAIDPAHLVPRSMGGCDDPECVVALCRRHHRAYDGGFLDLRPGT